MTLFSFVVTEKRKLLLEQIEKIPDAGKKGKAELIEMALEEYVKNHGSENPATKLDSWIQNPEYISIPALLANKEQRNKWLQIQVERKNWKDLGEIKYTLQEWQHQLKRLGV